MFHCKPSNLGYPHLWKPLEMKVMASAILDWFEPLMVEGRLAPRDFTYVEKPCKCKTITWVVVSCIQIYISSFFRPTCDIKHPKNDLKGWVAGDIASVLDHVSSR